MGKRANMPVACLPLLAALTPGRAHRHPDRRERRGRSTSSAAPGPTSSASPGMSVQRFRMKEILAELKRRGVLHRRRRAPGSPCRRTTSTAWPTSSSSARPRRPGRSSSSEWEQGLHQYRYEQAEKTDMTHGADAPVRPAQDAALRLRQPPVLARLPVPVRVLRHHRHLRPPPADQDQRADHRRARGPARPGDADRLHRRRQPDRQQEGDQGGAPRRDRLAGGRTATR